MKTVRHTFLGIAMVGIYLLTIQMSVVQAKDSRKRPILHEFLFQVTEDHPTMLSARAALRAIQARAKGKAKPFYNPELEVGYERAYENTKEIGISQSVDLSGKRSSRSSVGRAEVAEAKIIYDLEKKKLLTSILRRLADYQTALRQYNIMEERRILSDRFFKLIEQTSLTGQLPRSEFLTAKLALAKALADKNDAWVKLSRMEEGLIAVVGEEREIWPILTGVPFLDFSSLSNIDFLPEMLLARSKTETSRARIKVAKSDSRMDPTVGVRVGEEGNKSMFGLNISMPIPVWNNRKSSVYAANEDLIQAQQNYFATRRQVTARYEGSKKRYLSVAGAWMEWHQQGTIPLKEQRDLLERLLKAQEISALNYIIQLNQTFEIEAASLELNGRLWKASFAWQDASNSFDSWLEEIQ